MSYPNVRHLSLLIVAVLLVCPLFARGDGDDDKKKGSPVPSLEKLCEMVENLGYEVKTTKNNDGTVSATFTLTVETWNLAPILSLSNDKSMIWVYTGLQSLPNTASPPPDILLKLLSENERDNIFFSVAPRTGLVKLSLALPNKEITPAVLRRNLDAFKNRIAQTEELWNPKKWPAEKKPDKPA